MKRRLCGALLIVVASAACKKSATPANDAAAIRVPPAAVITVVGCVQPADRTATNAAGENDTKYMLTHTQRSNNGGTNSVGTSGSTRQPDSTYRLNASDSTLSPEVDHQVEIVAVVEEQAPASAGTMATTARPEAAPKLKVETIRMITAPCPS